MRREAWAGRQGPKCEGFLFRRQRGKTQDFPLWGQNYERRVRFTIWADQPGSRVRMDGTCGAEVRKNR